MIYLDYAATSPVSATAWAAMEPFLRQSFGNPAEPHAAGRAARAGLDAARAQTAEVLGLAPAEVIFTGGGSEADNIAVLGRTQGGGAPGRITASPIEHPAVREPLLALERAGWEIAWLEVDADGRVDLAAAARRILPGDALCAVMWANNLTGVVEPIAELAALCAERGVPFHADAVQSAAGARADVGALPGEVTVAIAAHKLGGPKGVGALAGRGLATLAPVMRGGGHEAGLRPGTQNVAGIAALAAALAERQQTGRAGEWARRAALRDRLEAGAGESVVGGRAERLPGHALFLCEGLRGDTLVFTLDFAGICVAAGSACSSGSSEPSFVLRALGVSDERARGALRVSLGWDTSEADVDSFIAAFADARATLASASGAL